MIDVLDRFRKFIADIFLERLNFLLTFYFRKRFLVKIDHLYLICRGILRNTDKDIVEFDRFFTNLLLQYFCH